MISSPMCISDMAPTPEKRRFSLNFDRLYQEFCRSNLDKTKCITFFDISYKKTQEASKFQRFVWQLYKVTNCSFLAYW